MNKHTDRSTETERTADNQTNSNEWKVKMDTNNTSGETGSGETPNSGGRAGIKIKHGDTNIEAGGPDPDGSTTKTILTILATGAVVIGAVAVVLLAENQSA